MPGLVGVYIRNVLQTSNDQLLTRAWGQFFFFFSCSADHEQDWQTYPVDPYSDISGNRTRQFHDGMQACVRFDDGVCPGWFAVEQGLRQGCVLAPSLLNIFFAAVINMAYTRFEADKNIMVALVQLENKTEAGGRGNRRRASACDVALGYAVRWRCQSRLAIARASENDDGVIMVVYMAFDLTVSEANPDIMCYA